MSQDGVGAPATRLQRTIADVWREVLELDALGVDEDFFELGGDSLAAVRMLAEIEDLLLAQVSFVDFIDRPTVAALADAVQQTRGQAQPSGPVLQRGPVDDLAPCTFAQERLWFVDQLSGNTGAYNEHLGTRIRGPLDPGLLERALRTIVQRHAALRTGFVVEDGTPMQLVHDTATLELERIDVSGASDPEADLRRVTRELVSTPFNLERAPLMRAALVELAPEDHVLQLVFHHNVTDGLSHVIVLRELARLYRAHAEGDADTLPEPALQYPDFARWHRERLSGQALEDAIAPWRERLADIPAAIDLPTDKPRPPVPSYSGATRRSQLSEATSERIREFARAEGATPFATLLAALDVVLARYSGQETIMVGSAMAGRDRPELENVVGLFANTVVLRNDVSGDPTFRELLGRVGRVVLDAVAHQDAPFERLVAALQQEPDLSRHPIFQVYLTMRPHATLELPGAEAYHAELLTARTDLTLWVEDAPGGYELTWEYSTDLFEPSTIQRLERHFIRLLEAALESPDLRIGALGMLEADERQRLLDASAAVEPDYQVACLHELFERQAELRPQAPAVVYEGTSLSYGELNNRANRLAHRLRELGIGPESMVALFLERSLDMMVAILAVLKAGGAYVPLDPEAPAARVSFVLGDSAAPVLLTQERLLDRLPEHGARTLCVDGDELGLDGQSSANPAPVATPESLAYVIYTSGSTGVPKGVQVEHRNVARLFSATDDWFSPGPSDAWTLFHSYAFDFSVWEIWGALLHGGRLVVVPQWVTRSPAALAELIADEGITVLNATPSLFVAAMGELIERAELMSLRLVIFGGEALQPPALRPWFKRFGDERPQLVNMYGITETTVHVTYRPLRASDAERESSPIGVPIPDLGLYLLDPNGEPVPPGLTGEIYVGGAGVARGYLNRPELNAERFLQSPFGPGRLYRSGDLARRRPDGEVAFLGRIDDQVKVRGFRIELGEIKSALEEHDAVAESAVVAVSVTPDDVRLAAYVVPDASQATPGVGLRESLRTLLEDRLPAYMVPSSITFVDELPLTTNGKLDRRALPAPEWEAARENAYVPPRTATEELIAGIWRETVGVERVGVDDNFFELGGHSLLAARVITRLRDSVGADVSVRMLFENPTLSGFASRVGQVSTVAVTEESGPAGDSADAPLSFQQQALLFFDALDPGSRTYNAPLAIGISGPLDAEALERAISQLVQRHEALRTVIATDVAPPTQVVLEDVSPALAVVELTPQELPARLESEASRPFDLARDVLLRATLFRLSGEEHVLLLQSHHIVLDGSAVQILYRDLSELYSAALNSRDPVLPELGMSYRDFARWQRARLSGERLARELEFWRAHLAGAPAMLEMPTDHPRPAEQTFEGATYRFELPGDLAQAVREVCEREQVTPYMLLMSAFATLLYRLSGDSDILLGGPMVNREHPGLESLVGFCANTVVVRAGLAGNPTFSELLARVRDSVLASYEHHEVPLELVVDAVRPTRLPGVNPLFQVNFRVSVGAPPTLTIDGAATRLIPVDLGHARFDLALELHVPEDRIEAELNWNTALFERATLERIAEEFERLLAQVTADPGRRLLELEIAMEERPAEQDASVGSIRGFRAGSRGG